MKHAQKTGRNELCPCGSGRKFKKCCEAKVQRGSRVLLIAVGAAVLGALLVGLASFTSDGTAGPRRVWSAEHGHYHDVP